MKLIAVFIIITFFYLINDTKSERYHGIFEIKNQNSIKKINYKQTFLCAIECIKTKDSNMVQIKDKKCEIQVNCASSNSNSSENNGVLFENFSKKKQFNLDR